MTREEMLLEAVRRALPKPVRDALRKAPWNVLFTAMIFDTDICNHFDVLRRVS